MVDMIVGVVDDNNVEESNIDKVRENVNILNDDILGKNSAIVPKVGMKFKDDNEVFEFYKRYAYLIGSLSTEVAKNSTENILDPKLSQPKERQRSFVGKISTLGPCLEDDSGITNATSSQPPTTSSSLSSQSSVGGDVIIGTGDLGESCVVFGGHSDNQEELEQEYLQMEQQPRRGVKQKNGKVEGRNQRVLRDIGNLVAVPAVEGKPQTRISRPETRSFCAQLLGNAQTAAEEQKNIKGVLQKPLAEVSDGVKPEKNDAAKDSVKPDKNAVIVISSDEEESLKTGRKLRENLSKKPGKTYTAVLTARSKAACGLAKKLKDPIVDIDTADEPNELAAVEYVEDIYKFYKLTEDDSRIHDYMDSQPEINSKMRAILVDWLVDVHKKFDLMAETLYLTVNIVDRFLSMKAVPRRELQLVGISSMLIASKYEEIWAPEVSDFIAISDNAYVRERVLLMEKAILRELEWYLTVPTPYVFLVRYIKASIPADQEMENMSFFFAELGLMHYSTITLYCPSKLAASSVYAARCTLNKNPLWTETLKHHTGYSEDQLRDCARLLVSFNSGVVENKLKAVIRKYSNPEKNAVALFPPAEILLPV
ncbi:Cyclin-B1-2 [Abeliophyllum distichum]|uniref:Cyclin-B1-2 n=1 Tax=Abeliophyllum distichum TaxID=126358 RepID=A0ABD1RAS9_9LAMI